MKKLSPEDLQNESEYELLTEVSHQHLREFVLELISKGKTIIRIYSIYQVIMMLLFAYLLTKGIVLFFKGHQTLACSSWFIHTLFTHCIICNYMNCCMLWLTWQQAPAGFHLRALPKKFVFYAMADRQVIARRAFHLVALTPFIVVKLICLAGVVYFYNEPLMYFFLSVMCLHSLFCAGDIAMLAFYKLYPEKEIYNFDNKSEGKLIFTPANKETREGRK